MARYLSDLLMSICLALTVGWLFQAATGNIHLRDAMITQNGTYVAISRFTPGNIATSYLDTVEHMTQLVPASYHLADGVGAVIEQTVVMVAGLLLAICVGVPATLIGLYLAAGGVAGWVVPGGFRHRDRRGVQLAAGNEDHVATAAGGFGAGTARHNRGLHHLGGADCRGAGHMLLVRLAGTLHGGGRDALLGLLAGISETSIAGL